MRRFRFILVALLVVCIVPVAAQNSEPQPVDANGVKVITITEAKKIGKQFKGDKKKDIKKLVIKEVGELGWNAGYYLEKELSKLSNLESMDASGSECASSSLTSLGSHHYDPSFPNLKTLRVIDIYERKFSGNDVSSIIGNILRGVKFPLKHINWYPSLTECTLADVWDGSSFHDIDSLYVNTIFQGQFVLVLLPKENSVCFKKVSNPESLNCQIVVGELRNSKCFKPANASLDGALAVDNHFLFGKEQSKIIVPASVKYILHSSGNGGSVNTLEIASSADPINIFLNGYDLTVKGSVIFNRPAVIHGVRIGADYNTKSDSIVFNKSVALESGTTIRGTKKLVFNDEATIAAGCENSDIETVVFNAQAKLGQKAFGNVGTMTFNAVPVLKENYAAADIVYVPKGVKANIPNSSSKMVYEMLPEKAREDLIAETIEIQTPGSLLSIIAPDKLAEIEDLTIVGQMNDEDAKVLTELGTYIRYLNLRECIILDSDDDSGVKDCVIPRDFMKGNSALREIILPSTAVYIEDYGVLSDCPNLKKVTFPPYLESIGFAAFQNCLALEEIVLPNTVRYIGERLSKDYDCFVNCPNLKRVIFNSSTFRTNTYLFSDCNKLEEIRLPAYEEWSGGYYHQIGKSPLQNVKVYVPENVTSFTGQYVGCEVYFQSPKAPKGSSLKFENCTIYCPKGATTSYFSVFGKNNKYVEATFPTIEADKDEYALKYITNQKQLRKRLEETKAKKADAEWRRKYGDNAEPCMQCYGTGIYSRKVGNNYNRQFCPYCNASGVVHKK